MSNEQLQIELGTIADACKIIGGDTKPISRWTYWRGVREGRYPPPVHVSPNVLRVNLRKLRASIAALTGEEAHPT
jgi:hypothetical protein